jgi:hypothetical protein
MQQFSSYRSFDHKPAERMNERENNYLSEMKKKGKTQGEKPGQKRHRETCGEKTFRDPPFKSDVRKGGTCCKQ